MVESSIIPGFLVDLALIIAGVIVSSVAAYLAIRARQLETVYYGLFGVDGILQGALDRINTRLEHLGDEMEEMNVKIDEIERKTELDSVVSKKDIDSIKTRLGNVEEKLDSLDDDND